MAKITPFEKFSEEYDEWFVRNKDKYEAELRALSYFIPPNGNGLEVGVGSGKFAGPLGIKQALNLRKKWRIKRKNWEYMFSPVLLKIYRSRTVPLILF